MPTAALALSLAAGLSAASEARHKWDFAPFSTLKVGPAERGAAANGQPLRVDPAALAQALGSVRLVTKKAEEPLFAPAEISDLAPALAEALAVAGPGEDLELQSTRKRDKAIFSSSMAVTARFFAQDGKLNLIIHDARLDYHLEYNLENRLPNFEYGSRTTPGHEVLKAQGAEVRRPDWLVLPLLAPAVVVPPEPVAAPAPAAVVARPVAAPAPVAKQPEPPGRSREDRLKELKRLREQDLITEAEYAKQKAEILKELVTP